MPYCQPMNVYHREGDIGAGAYDISYCPPCHQWHHNGYRCPCENGYPFRHLTGSAESQPYGRDVTGALVSTLATVPSEDSPELPSDSEDSPEREDLPSASELDLTELYRSSPLARRSMNSEFRNYLRTLVSDPDEIDDVEFCTDCRDPAWEDEMYPTGNGRRVCETCREDYSDCSSCEELFADGYLTETLAGDHVCERCRGNYYSYCEHCDGYYPDDYSCDHDHDDGSGCCDSPQLQFTVRNDGAEPLANDTRVAFTLPAGVISPAGLRAIRDYLCGSGHYDLTDGIEALGDQWQTRNGNYAKRLSRYAYQAHQAKLTPETMSQIGTIARDHSKPVEVEIEVTREFNQSAAYFYHEDSCYWGGYYESRCALKTNGAFGLRSFKDGEVSGRAWVMPLRFSESGTVPTFDTMGSDAFVVFNGYGDLGGYAAARIVSHMAGWTYRKIGFGCEPMYINAGGYLVAPEHIAEPYTDGSLRLSVPQHSDLYESEKVNA